MIDRSQAKVFSEGIQFFVARLFGAALVTWNQLVSTGNPISIYVLLLSSSPDQSQAK